MADPEDTRGPLLEPWTIAPCVTCGADYQATRTRSGYAGECEACESYGRGYADGSKQGALQLDPEGSCRRRWWPPWTGCWPRRPPWATWRRAWAVPRRCARCGRGRRRAVATREDEAHREVKAATEALVRAERRQVADVLGREVARACDERDDALAQLDAARAAGRSWRRAFFGLLVLAAAWAAIAHL